MAATGQACFRSGRTASLAAIALFPRAASVYVYGPVAGPLQPAQGASHDARQGEGNDMSKSRTFRGSMTALVTPFKNGALDEAAFRAHVDWQIESGTSGLVPVGTTGESPTLSHDEHRKVVEWCIGEARGRVPVIAGAGSNNTSE